MCDLFLHDMAALSLVATQLSHLVVFNVMIYTTEHTRCVYMLYRSFLHCIHITVLWLDTVQPPLHHQRLLHSHCHCLLVPGIAL